MKQSLLLVTLILIFTACNLKNEMPTPTQQKEETPKALKEESADASYVSKRGGGDLVDELYNELLEKDTLLKNIESMMDVYRKGKPDSLEAFNRFNSKNHSYYSSAYNYLTEIKDSLLVQKIKAAIADGESNYRNKTAGFEALIKEIEKKTSSIEDLHVALKITKTLTVMKNFQQQNLPSSRPVEAVLNAGEKIIAKEDAAIKQ